MSKCVICSTATTYLFHHHACLPTSLPLSIHMPCYYIASLRWRNYKNGPLAIVLSISKTPKSSFHQYYQLSNGLMSRPTHVPLSVCLLPSPPFIIISSTKKQSQKISSSLSLFMLPPLLLSSSLLHHANIYTYNTCSSLLSSPRLPYFYCRLSPLFSCMFT